MNVYHVHDNTCDYIHWMYAIVNEFPKYKEICDNIMNFMYKNMVKTDMIKNEDILVFCFLNLKENKYNFRLRVVSCCMKSWTNLDILYHLPCSFF